MKKYILKINEGYLVPEASSLEFVENKDIVDSSYLQIKSELNEVSDVVVALNELGYNPDDFEIGSILLNGGEYTSPISGDIEWGLDIVEVEEKPEFEDTFEGWKNDHENLGLENVYKFSHGKGLTEDISDLTNNQINAFREQNKENYSGEDIHYINLKDGTSWSKLSGVFYNEKGDPIEGENLDKSFNEAEEFVKQYRDYLIGKKLSVLLSNTNYNTIRKIINVSTGRLDEENKNYIIVNISLDDDYIVTLRPENFQKFIDGEEIYEGEHLQFALTIQEEKIEEPIIEEKVEEKINQSDYKYYLVNLETKKIQTGWEYKEDAEDALKEAVSFGQKDVVVNTKKSLINQGLNPDENESWLTDSHDWAIIEEAFKLAVNKGELNQDQANKYIDGFKDGQYTHVVKAWLITYLKDIQKSLSSSFVNSNIEKAKQILEYDKRTEKELMKILSMEK